uniref:Uncharacterized protein n=1 Tax=Siphoviridae sp. ctzyE57 TaxID=2827982 RepID=A0A8S5SHG8_9CAUD|nr:MAG TPA: hypothetical protein [Siphoviridae sp. ctzyE57]
MFNAFASCSCVMPFLMRASFILLPMLMIFSPPFFCIQIDYTIFLE